MPQKSIIERIKQRARELGFDLIGIAPATPHPHLSLFDSWLQKGFAGSMSYLERRHADRADPKCLLPSVQSIICCGLNYYGGKEASQALQMNGRGWISRYAWGEDYHDVLLHKLQRLEDFIRKNIDPQAALKSYVDTGPILERSYAASAGLGWIGKNTMLINRKVGSFFFLGEILCSLDLPVDGPTTDHCGQCRLCIDHCPTGALKPHELDATRCISYLTIEHRGAIPETFHAKIGHHIFGCDICQDVCPWNQDIAPSQQEDFKPRNGLFHPRIDELSQLDKETFRKKFKGSPIKRSQWEGFKRNLEIVRGNQAKGETQRPG